MIVAAIKRYYLWVALAVVVLIAIYLRFFLHRAVPGFDEEAVRNLMAK